MTIDGLITEQEKTDLINEYLSVERIEKSDYYKKYLWAMSELENKLDYLSDKNEKLRSIDRVDVIPGDVYDIYEETISEAAAQVRDKTVAVNERIKACNLIMQYTVSVSKFRANADKSTEKINLNFNQIPVLRNCSYTQAQGMIFADERNRKRYDTGNSDSPGSSDLSVNFPSGEASADNFL